MILTRLRSAVIVFVLVVVLVLVGDWYFNSDMFHNSNALYTHVSESETQSAVHQRPFGIGDQHRPFGQRRKLDSKQRETEVHRLDKDAWTDSSPTVSLPHSDEISTVLRRMDTCLVATNMSLYFRSNGYYDRAQNNARLLLEGLRQVIPKFTAPYTVPCWNTLLKASRESKRLIKHHRFSTEVTGSVGEFTFSHTYEVEAHNIILRTIEWSRKGQEIYIEQSVACLPKIFLLGYPKCGSTFLYCLLRKVLKLTLDVMGRCEVVKEPHWWVVPGPRQLVQSPSPDYVPLYLLNFYKGAKYREMDMPAITIDASPNLMFQWPRYSENETMENYCLLPSLIPVVLPDSKYFVVMRNPISMLYSAFWFSCTMTGRRLDSVKYKGPDIFHERITTKIETFNQCKSKGKPLDECVDMVAPNLYGQELPTCGRTRLEMGLYYFHARKWLSVIPRERLHVFTLEELATQDLKSTAKVILDFLEIPTPQSDVDFSAMKCQKNSQSVIDYKHDPRLKMREDTRQVLEEFFKPYNQMLADLLGDDKFLWSTNSV